MKLAIFLDRDGVINPPVLNKNTNKYEAPHSADDFELFSWSIQSVQDLAKLGYMLFLVSNQPDFAKGKTSLTNLQDVHSKMHAIFLKNNINFTEYYYCYHHPNGIIPDYSIKCECRKPGNYFLKEALHKYNLDMKGSWFIGDRDSDIYCGQSMETKTILIKTQWESLKAGKSSPDYIADNLQKATETVSAYR